MAFYEYARQNKLPNISRNSFYQRIPKHLRVELVKRGPIGNQRHAFTGILLRPKDMCGPFSEDELLKRLNSNPSPDGGLDGRRL
jgi:hypothetical protein